MRKNGILMTVIHIFIIVFVFFLKSAIVFPNDAGEMKFLEYLLMGVYIYTFFTAKIYSDWLNSYMIFLYTLFLFNFTRVFLDIVGYKEFGWATKFANYYFFYDVRIEIINVFLLVLLFTHLGFFIGIINETESEMKSRVTLKNRKIYTDFGMFLFIIALPALAYKMFIQLRIILQAGYEAYYTGILKGADYPFFTKGSGTIMTIGFLIFLISVPSKKKFLTVSSLYLMVKLLDSFKGARAIFLTQLLFIMWYYAKVYGIKIKMKTMGKLVGFTVIFSQLLVSVRSKKVFSLDLINTVYNFLFSQGVSYLVLGYTIDFKSRIVGQGSYPYVFQGIFGFKPQSLETLTTTNSLADKLTYLLNPTAYLKGEGIGSNYIAEMYDLGYLWIIIMSVLLGIFIVKYEKYVVKNRFLLLTSYYFIPNLFYIPRGSFFGEALIKNMIMLISVYVLIFGFDYMYRKIEEKCN
ncbi:MAG: O-antigen polysaccharide polymerase Wzy family protein, partial [Pseudoleptotrichia goodfellowii]|nr:O-antigen polysaccharide polymerase Wzy family protein [Pseudoleptotrichia goodfellowii]